MKNRHGLAVLDKPNTKLGVSGNYELLNHGIALKHNFMPQGLHEAKTKGFESFETGSGKDFHEALENALQKMQFMYDCTIFSQVVMLEHKDYKSLEVPKNWNDSAYFVTVCYITKED
jgi:hypothetical protein